MFMPRKPGRRRGLVGRRPAGRADVAGLGEHIDPPAALEGAGDHVIADLVQISLRHVAHDAQQVLHAAGVQAGGLILIAVGQPIEAGANEHVRRIEDVIAGHLHVMREVGVLADQHRAGRDRLQDRVGASLEVAPGG